MLHAHATALQEGEPRAAAAAMLHFNLQIGRFRLLLRRQEAAGGLLWHSRHLRGAGRRDPLGPPGPSLEIKGQWGQ